MAMLTTAEQNDLMVQGSVRAWAAGETIFQEKEHGTSVLILLSGQVQASSLDNGRVVVVLGPGSLLEEVPAISGRTRSATVRTLGPTRTLALAIEKYRAFLQEHSAIPLALRRRYLERSPTIDRMRV
ncbi:cyclic nucleotide-binding domain-containing protein [Actinomadura citrea]|uniref:cyclic nucleotide-binding domain-containing protein n=1 Tax=Actinomadura citrea TaxID=46158 RepID=UPI003CE48E8B